MLRLKTTTSAPDLPLLSPQVATRPWNSTGKPSPCVASVCSSSGDGPNSTQGTWFTRSLLSPSSWPSRVSTQNRITFRSAPFTVAFRITRPPITHMFMLLFLSFLPAPLQPSTGTIPAWLGQTWGNRLHEQLALIAPSFRGSTLLDEFSFNASGVRTSEVLITADLKRSAFELVIE